MKSTYQQCLEDLESSPMISFWLKAAVKALDRRDPVDALKDAELLVKVCEARLLNLKTKGGF